MDLAAFKVIAFLDLGLRKVVTLMVQPFLCKWFKGIYTIHCIHLESVFPRFPYN